MQDKANKNKPDKLDLDLPFMGVGITQKLLFARHLSVMLKSGLTMMEALEIIHEQARGKFKGIVFDIMASVGSGNPLSSALRKYPKIFSDLFINTAYAGEVSGTLNANLGNIADQLKGEKELISKIRGAMVYPIIVITATAVLGIAMAFLVLPKITPLFEGLDLELPITTKLLIWISGQIQANGFWILTSIAMAVVSVLWLANQRFTRPATHYLLLRIPVIQKISHNMNLARFSRTLATLLKSGLNIDEALRITKDTLGNHYYKAAMAKIERRISHGSPLSDNLAEHSRYFPKMVVSMVRVGERSGNLEESLFYLAEFYDTEVDNSTKTLSTALEPILLLGIGLIVGGMALSIVTPIYEITGSINQ